MPFYFNPIPNLPQEISMQTWEIIEDVDYYLANTPPDLIGDITNRTSSSQKQKESLACRFLLGNEFNRLQIPISPIIYNHEGKPVLKNEIHFSFTHTSKFAACALSQTNEIGIDIESNHRSKEKIAARFLNAQELLIFQSPLQITLSWCIKEAIYKSFGKKGLSFREQIAINFNGDSFVAHVITPEKRVDFTLYYTQNELFTTCVAVPNHPTT
ncbi:MAG: hypothetical protein RI995_457 [Bacteroidota bacterium]